MGGREIIRGSAADLMSSCCCCCDEIELGDWMLGWSEEEADEEEERRGEFVVVEAARLVDLLLVDMLNLGREGVVVVGRYGEEARGRVERAERSWRGGGMMG